MAFLTDVIASQRPKQVIHAICDNVSRHKTACVHEFLQPHRNVRLHCTPRYPSWLNQVENGFSRINDAVD